MDRRVIVNWKMHFSLQEATAFCTQIPKNKHLIIAAPTLYLAELAGKFPKISFAAQNVSAHEQDGPYTGEISAKQLASCGIRYCLIGHPERRRDFDEDDVLVKLKIKACEGAGVVPIVCLGEDLSLAGELVAGSFVAYEPTDSIGTGVLPSKDYLDKVFDELKRVVDKSVHLVYGGSVNSGNLSLIKSISAIDSILVGGAGLKSDELMKILRDW